VDGNGVLAAMGIAVKKQLGRILLVVLLSPSFPY
jgi:hypothetical protein